MRWVPADPILAMEYVAQMAIFVSEREAKKDPQNVGSIYQAASYSVQLAQGGLEVVIRVRLRVFDPPER